MILVECDPDEFFCQKYGIFQEKDKARKRQRKCPEKIEQRPDDHWDD